VFPGKKRYASILMGDPPPFRERRNLSLHRDPTAFRKPEETSHPSTP